VICIIDYGSGNVRALMNLMRRARIPHFLSGNPDDLARADRFLLPGVGAFDPTMARLEESGLISALEREVMGNGKRVLGICVGMHLLGQGSDEGTRPGLGWVPGRVRQIDPSKLEAPPLLPHMGWNSISPRPGEPLFDGIDEHRGYYFLHSYFFDAAHDVDVLARVDYGGALPCAVGRGQIAGVQFHPEKSHNNGVALLSNFATLP
jgi:imidazole glycerol-phosphate synthase subunit HisH